MVMVDVFRWGVIGEWAVFSVYAAPSVFRWQMEVLLSEVSAPK